MTDLTLSIEDIIGHAIDPQAHGSWAYQGTQVVKAIEDGGYQIVPNDPTGAMMKAAWDVSNNNANEFSPPEDIYKAMLEAAQEGGG